MRELKLDRNTDLARVVDVMMARAKRIYILIIKVKKLFSFVVAVFSITKSKTCTPCFYPVIETLVNTWENSKKLWKHSPAARLPTAFLILPNFNPVSITRQKNETSFFSADYGR